jgi:hypothetical protein
VGSCQGQEREAARVKRGKLSGLRGGSCQGQEREAARVKRGKLSGLRGGSCQGQEREAARVKRGKLPGLREGSCQLCEGYQQDSAWIISRFARVKRLLVHFLELCGLSGFKR